MNTTLLDKEELCEATRATCPAPEVSKKYTFVSTSNIINAMANHQYYPVESQQVKKRTNAQHAKHFVRFRHISDIQNPGDEAIDIVIVNSHDRSASIQVRVGVFRFVCANGMFVGQNMVTPVRIRHAHFTEAHLIDEIQALVKSFIGVRKFIAEMKNVTLSEARRVQFAKEALEIVYSKTESPIAFDQILEARRTADHASDLYTVMNVVQENIIRGGVTIPKNEKRKKSGRTRGIKQIDKNIKINVALWDLAASYIHN